MGLGEGGGRLLGGLGQQLRAGIPANVLGLEVCRLSRRAHAACLKGLPWGGDIPALAQAQWQVQGVCMNLARLQIRSLLPADGTCRTRCDRQALGRVTCMHGRAEVDVRPFSPPNGDCNPGCDEQAQRRAGRDHHCHLGQLHTCPPPSCQQSRCSWAPGHMLSCCCRAWFCPWRLSPAVALQSHHVYVYRVQVQMWHRASNTGQQPCAWLSLSPMPRQKRHHACNLRLVTCYACWASTSRACSALKALKAGLSDQ